MIKASEAKRKSLVNSKGKKLLEKLERQINRAVDDGVCSASINIGMLKPENDFRTENQELMDAVVKELVNLGYKVEFKFADSLPAGCPSDQWQFENGYIRVEW